MTSDESNLDKKVDYKSTINLPQTDFPMRGEGPKREPEIQKFWFENNIYFEALDKRKNSGSERFLLHDGPPYLSSGNIHIGTALNKILKDIVVKYKTLKGFYSPYLPGFDCHGLPIESAIQRSEIRGQKSESKEQKMLTPLEVRKQCTEFVLKNRKLQEEKFKRLGVLGDWKNSYMTIHSRFEANQLRMFAAMVDKGYIYRGLKPVYWCPSCQTALAEAEVEYVENYKSPSIYVAFDVKTLSSTSVKLSKYNNLKVVIWTTTPWTIPGNLAICLNSDFNYSVISTKSFGHLILATDLLETFFKTTGVEVNIVDSINGKDLEKSICKHPLYDRESPIILGKHVTLEAGTGCVHTAPGHGLEDFAVGYEYGLKVFSPVNSKGLLTDEAGSELKGLYVHKAANQKVIELLQNCGALIYQSDYLHSYPHCWRSKTPIIFRATKQWFCSVKDFRQESLDEIKKVNWIPKVGENRISAMVESRTDWCISRQRVWGVPIPAFYCNECGKEHLNKNIIEYVAKLIEDFGVVIDDFKISGSDIWWEKSANELLPKDYTCSCGANSFTKETDTMDVWFDSGSTHFSVVDQNKDLFNNQNIGTPVEMYLEGSDQHRGWFQSSLLTSVSTKKRAPYKTVLTHGFVLDESGRKMSKSMGNVVDPEKVISQYGADILRLWVASVDYATDMRIGENMLKQLAEVYRNIRNTVRFILGNLYDYDKNNDSVKYENLWNIDKYALYKLEEIKRNILDAFNTYEFYRYYQLLQNYCAVDLSSFYFDLNKDRLYVGNKASRKSVQFVLKEIFDTLLPLLVPVLPHLAEDIWKYAPLNIKNQYDSSLFLLFPKQNDTYMNSPLVSDFTELLYVKNLVYKAIEDARANKQIGKSIEARATIAVKDKSLHELLNKYKSELPTVYIVSQVEIVNCSDSLLKADFLSTLDDSKCFVAINKADGEKCPRCWKISNDIGQNLKHKPVCLSCATAVEESFVS